MSQKQILIDVEKALMSKTKGKKPSKLLVYFLKKIAHQDEMNSFLKKNPDIEGLDFLEKTLDYLQIKLITKGIDSLPKDRTYIFASNHPMGGLDGMAMGYFLGRHFDNKIKLLSNDLLMNVTPLHSLFIPVNKHGGQGKEILNGFNDAFASDNQILIYPAGLCSRLHDGKVYDLQWKKTFVTKAIEYKRDIVPIFFEAKNSRFFYILAYLRKKLKIKLNIEMLFLVDEMYKQRNKTFTAYIGEPISWESLDTSKTHLQWAQHIKGIVYNLKQKTLR